MGDRVFAGIARAAGIMILAALAGVFVFLLIEGSPGLTPAGVGLRTEATNFFGYVGPLLFGTVARRDHRADHRRPLALRHRAGHQPLRARGRSRPRSRYVIDLLAAVPCVVFGLWGISVLAPRHGAGLSTGSPTTLGCLPFFEGPASATGPHHPDRRHRAGDHDPADHHRDLPRGVRADAAAARGGRPGAGRHALGDDPDGGLPLRPLRHGLGRHARPRPRARRDDGRGHGALRRRRRHPQPDLGEQPRARSRPTSPPTTRRARRRSSAC